MTAAPKKGVKLETIHSAIVVDGYFSNSKGENRVGDSEEKESVGVQTPTSG